MLVLSRKPGEAIIVEGPCRIVVVSIEDGRVKLGIQAERGVVIDREEVHERRVMERAAS